MNRCYNLTRTVNECSQGYITFSRRSYLRAGYWFCNSILNVVWEWKLSSSCTWIKVRMEYLSCNITVPTSWLADLVYSIVYSYQNLEYRPTFFLGRKQRLFHNLDTCSLSSLLLLWRVCLCRKCWRPKMFHWPLLDMADRKILPSNKDKSCHDINLTVMVVLRTS